MNGCLDWAASIDTVDPKTLESIGRTTTAGPLSEADYLRIMNILRQHDIRLKINTVVTRRNCDEDRFELTRCRQQLAA